MRVLSGGVAHVACVIEDDLEGRQTGLAKPQIAAPAFCTFRRGFDFLRKLLFSSKQKAIKLIASLIPTPQNIRPSLCN